MPQVVSNTCLPPTLLPATALCVCVSFRGCFLPRRCSLAVWLSGCKMDYNLSSEYVEAIPRCCDDMMFGCISTCLSLFHCSCLRTWVRNKGTKTETSLSFCYFSPCSVCTGGYFQTFGQLLAFGSNSSSSIFSTLRWLTLLRRKHSCGIMKIISLSLLAGGLNAEIGASLERLILILLLQADQFAVNLLWD